MADPNPPAECAACADLKRPGHLSPPDRYFSCAECGKRFERVIGNEASDKMIERLLTPIPKRKG